MNNIHNFVVTFNKNIRYLWLLSNKHFIMVTIIKRGISLETLNSILVKLAEKKKKGLNAKMFCGTLKLEEDSLNIQKKLRDEWK